MTSVQASTTPVDTKAFRIANDFGLAEAVIGIVAGFLLSSIGIGIYGSVVHHAVRVDSLGGDITSLFGLWIGLLGAAVVASRNHALRVGLRPSFRQFAADFGVELRPWPDLLLGIGVGVGAQYLLVPLLELPLLPFVPHLFNRLGTPAKNLTGGVTGGGLVVLGVLVCLGSPMFEELFFRGLLLRGLFGSTARFGRLWGPTISILSAGILFGLLHFEALQLLGLIGFGVVLGLLATRTGRLGPGFIAHMAFNATTFIALAIGH